jgi:thioredoxin 1
MSTNIKHVTEAGFADEVLHSASPVLVDFWAEWCGPCKMIAPVLEESAESYAGRMNVAKVNVDENQALAARYHVRGIPTLVLFKDGEVVATKVGAVSKSQLAAFIDANLSSRDR